MLFNRFWMVQPKLGRNVNPASRPQVRSENIRCLVHGSRPTGECRNSSGVDSATVRESNLDALVELYAGLQEDDLFYGLGVAVVNLSRQCCPLL